MSADNYHLVIEENNNKFLVYRDLSISDDTDPRFYLRYSPTTILDSIDAVDRFLDGEYAEGGVAFITAEELEDDETFNFHNQSEERVKVGYGDVYMWAHHLPTSRLVHEYEGHETYPCYVSGYVNPQFGKEITPADFIMSQSWNVPEYPVIDLLIQVPNQAVKIKIENALGYEDDFNMCHNPNKKKHWYVTNPKVIKGIVEEQIRRFEATRESVM